MADTRICVIESCGKVHHALGYCKNHHRRLRRTGSPFLSKTTLQTLMEVVADPPEECVEWPYFKNEKGYGIVTIKGKTSTAHRAAWELYHGRTMGALCHAAHKPVVCHNRACFNPLHVREASAKDNHSDKQADGTWQGGVSNPRAKLTEQQVRDIRGDNSASEDIARKFNVSASAIRSIKTRKTWKHI